MTTYQDIIDEMEPGLDRCILSILDKRKGIEKAVKKGELTALTRQMGFHIKDERQLRIAISRLRKEGVNVTDENGKEKHITVLIGSLSKVGYFMISNRAEWEEVKNNEFLSRIKDMNETIRIMESNVRATFGDAWQEGLI